MGLCVALPSFLIGKTRQVLGLSAYCPPCLKEVKPKWPLPSSLWSVLNLAPTGVPFKPAALSITTSSATEVGTGQLRLVGERAEDLSEGV